MQLMHPDQVPRRVRMCILEPSAVGSSPALLPRPPSASPDPAVCPARSPGILDAVGVGCRLPALPAVAEPAEAVPAVRPPGAVAADAGVVGGTPPGRGATARPTGGGDGQGRQLQVRRVVVAGIPVPVADVLGPGEPPPQHRLHGDAVGQVKGAVRAPRHRVPVGPRHPIRIKLRRQREGTRGMLRM